MFRFFLFFLFITSYIRTETDTHISSVFNERTNSFHFELLLNVNSEESIEIYFQEYDKENYSLIINEIKLNSVDTEISKDSIETYKLNKGDSLLIIYDLILKKGSRLFELYNEYGLLIIEKFIPIQEKFNLKTFSFDLSAKLNWVIKNNNTILISNGKTNFTKLNKNGVEIFWDKNFENEYAKQLLRNSFELPTTNSNYFLFFVKSTQVTDLYLSKKIRIIEFDKTYLKKELFSRYTFLKILYESLLNTSINEKDIIYKGLAGYFAIMQLKKQYYSGSLFFDFIKIFPIYGISVFSYNYLPIIYSIGNYSYQPEDIILEKYYSNKDYTSFADIGNSKMFEYEFEYNKTESVVFSLTISNVLGESTFINLIKEFLKKDFLNNNLPFIEFLAEKDLKNIELVLEEMYYKNPDYDYKIQLDKSGRLLKIYNDGISIFKNKIRLYYKDKVIDIISDIDKSVFSLEVEKGLIGIEIDPERINLFERNFANNSFFVEGSFSAPVSMAVRWFFWIQNSLLILGSLG